MVILNQISAQSKVQVDGLAKKREIQVDGFSTSQGPAEVTEEKEVHGDGQPNQNEVHVDGLVLKANSVHVDGQEKQLDQLCLLTQSTNVDSYRKLVEILVPVIPKSLVRSVLHDFHDTPECAHLGVNKTLDKIKKRCFWDGMNKDIRDYIRSCEICQKTNPSNTLPYGLLQPIDPPTHVFETVCVDFMGPFVRSTKGNQHLLVVVDQLSKWIEIIPFRSATAKMFVEVMEDNIFCRYGPPKRMLSDNGAQFRSKAVKIMCKQWGVSH